MFQIYILIFFIQFVIKRSMYVKNLWKRFAPSAVVWRRTSSREPKNAIVVDHDRLSKLMFVREYIWLLIKRSIKRSSISRKDFMKQIWFTFIRSKSWLKFRKTQWLVIMIDDKYLFFSMTTTPLFVYQCFWNVNVFVISIFMRMFLIPYLSLIKRSLKTPWNVSFCWLSREFENNCSQWNPNWVCAIDFITIMPKTFIEMHLIENKWWKTQHLTGKVRLFMFR